MTLFLNSQSQARSIPGHFACSWPASEPRNGVVYAKPPFGGPDQVLGYLANYTHRIAISNSRIVSFTGEHVTFRYRDAPGSHRNMTLSAHEFLRRFLLHVIPKRFVRILYYGFMANRTRASCLDRAHRLIGHCLPPTLRPRSSGLDSLPSVPYRDPARGRPRRA